MKSRLGALAIVVEGGKDSALNVQALLSDFSDIIIGRMGIPSKELDVSVITVTVKGTLERISSLSGKLGKLQNVTVKSAITSIEI